MMEWLTVTVIIVPPGTTTIQKIVVNMMMRTSLLTKCAVDAKSLVSWHNYFILIFSHPSNDKSIIVAIRKHNCL